VSVLLPAQVYEPSFTKTGSAPAEGKLTINFSNCVHCKTCDIMDPYQINHLGPPARRRRPRLHGDVTYIGSLDG